MKQQISEGHDFVFLCAAGQGLENAAKAPWRMKNKDAASELALLD